jgi:predicted metal-dependent phosphoesterase TrpH
MIPGRRIDLHMHTSRSDGRFPPEEVLARCAAGKLELVAITDHDLPQALAPGPRTIDGHTLHLLGAAEVSGMHDGREYHLLVYFRGDVPEGFKAFCAAQVKERAERYDRTLSRLGLSDLPPAGDAARDGDLSLTRHHLARALVASGHANDMREAFSKYVGEAAGQVPAFDLSYVDAIRVARSFGGLTSWAHPPLEAVERHLDTFVAAGLQGLEGVRPSVSSKDRRIYRRAAQRHRLYVTAGSDWHGWYEGDLGLFYADPQDVRGFLDALEAA